jgi:hypothetical protein
MSRHSKRTEKEKSASYLFIERQTARMREALRAENSSTDLLLLLKDRPAVRSLSQVSGYSSKEAVNGGKNH